MENLPVIQIGWWHSWSARQVYSLHQPKSLLRQIIYSWAPSLWGGHGKCRLTLVLANSLKHRFALRSGPWCPSEHISKSPIVDRNTEFSNPHIDFGAQSSTIITHPVCLGYLRPVKCFKHKRVLHKSFTQIFNCALILCPVLYCDKPVLLKESCSWTSLQNSVPWPFVFRSLLICESSLPLRGADFLAALSLSTDSSSTPLSSSLTLNQGVEGSISESYGGIIFQVKQVLSTPIWESSPTWITVYSGSKSYPIKVRGWKKQKQAENLCTKQFLLMILSPICWWFRK